LSIVAAKPPRLTSKNLSARRQAAETVKLR
jgi:hypothetical protein